jgi:hypothetical protein
MATIPALSNAAISAVQDTSVRSILRSLSDYLAVRNGDTGNGKEAFLTLDDLTGDGATAQAVASALAKPIGDGIGTAKPGSPLDNLGQQLEDRILSSAAWQAMFARIDLIAAPDSVPGSASWLLLQEAKARGAAVTNVSTQLQSTAESLAKTTTTLTASIKDNAAAITQEAKVRADANTATATRLDIMATSVGQNTAAIQSEASTRVNNDNALVQAINTMWARVGSSAALVQGGTNIAVNDIGSTVTKFEQLQAIITDPVTGLKTTAALKTDLSLTNDKVNGLSGKWGVKLDLNGYVSGVSLNSGVSTGGKAESSFLVLANTFAVGSPGKPEMVPFAIDTATGLVSIRGDLLVKKSITAASGVIGDAAITNANIKNAAVDTLKIGGNAVTIPVYMEGFNDGTNFNSGSLIPRGSVTMVLPDTGSVVAIITWQTLSANAGDGFNSVVDLSVDGRSILHQSNSGMSGYNQTFSTATRTTVGPGAHTFTVSFGNDWSVGWYQLGRWSVTLLGVMR